MVAFTKILELAGTVLRATGILQKPRGGTEKTLAPEEGHRLVRSVSSCDSFKTIGQHILYIYEEYMKPSIKIR